MSINLSVGETAKVMHALFEVFVERDKYTKFVKLIYKTTHI